MHFLVGLISANERAKPAKRRRSSQKGSPRMARLFRFDVDEVELTDAAFAFVTDPLPSRNERPLIHELSDIYPDMVDVLECMVLDGTEERQDVADYIQAVVGQFAG